VGIARVLQANVVDTRDVVYIVINDDKVVSVYRSRTRAVERAKEIRALAELRAEP
jgi:hypothetical protein